MSRAGWDNGNGNEDRHGEVNDEGGRGRALDFQCPGGVRHRGERAA